MAKLKVVFCHNPPRRTIMAKLTQEITYIKANRQTAINAPRKNDGQIPQQIRRETTVPQRANAKCQADPALLAQVVIDKFVDHKPLRDHCIFLYGANQLKE